MANIDYNKVASDAKDVFSLIAGLRDVGRQIRTLAIEMGVEGGGHGGFVAFNGLARSDDGEMGADGGRQGIA